MANDKNFGELAFNNSNSEFVAGNDEQGFRGPAISAYTSGKNQQERFTILNIWASWCVPCRAEHPKLIELSKNKSIKLIGLNYRDNPKNAKKFINEFGDPYFMIIKDNKGIISVDLGAIGVPETFIINKDKKIIKRFLGSLTEKSLNKINLITK